MADFEREIREARLKHQQQSGAAQTEEESILTVRQQQAIETKRINS